jgi:hypothetical protein
MAATQQFAATAVPPAGALPGPPELLPGRPDAIVDLQTDAGCALVGGTAVAANCWVAAITRPPSRRSRGTDPRWP